MQRTCDAFYFQTHFESLGVAEHVIVAILVLLGVLSCLASNVAVILTINNSEKLKSALGLLWKNVAFSDMMFGVPVALLFAVSEFQLARSVRSRNVSMFATTILFNKTFLIIQGVLFYTSLLIAAVWTTLITLDRCVLLYKPVRYEARKSSYRYRMKVTCSVIWLLMLLAFTYPAFEHLLFFAISPEGPYVVVVERCISTGISPFQWAVIALVSANTFLLLLLLGLQTYFLLRRWKNMSASAKGRQWKQLRITTFMVIFYIVPSVLYVAAIEMRVPITTTPAILSTLLVFCFVRCTLTFVVYYIHDVNYATSYKSLLEETIPRKVTQFKARHGCIDLN